jgi:hypothetical protein
MRDKKEAWEAHLILSRVQESVREWTKWAPTLGVGVPMDSRILQRVIAEVKTHWIEEIFISLEIYWNLDVWNGLYDSFRHLKHKLWPKERPGVKLADWLPTIKSQKSTRFPCLQVACDIPSESSQRRLQLCFRSHLNWRFSCKIMRTQSWESLNFGNFGTPLGQNAI